MGSLFELVVKLGLALVAWVAFLSTTIFLVLWRYDALPPDLEERIDLVFGIFVVSAVSIMVLVVKWASTWVPKQLAARRKKREDAQVVEQLMYGDFLRLTSTEKAALRIFRDRHYQALPFREVVTDETSREAVRRLVVSNIVLESGSSGRDHRIVLYDDTWAAITHRPDLFDA
jgi:hypothetical protein